MRRKPLDRGKPLERRSELKADVEKVREFMRRGRQGLERAPLRSSSAFRKAKLGEGPLSPRDWQIAVFAAATSDVHERVHFASGGVCRITGSRARDVDDRRFHAHHPLAKRVLRDRKLSGYVWDPRNGVWIRRDVHVRHEDAFERIPHTALPVSVWEFCAELDALEGTRWATDLVLRAHPVRS